MIQCIATMKFAISFDVLPVTAEADDLVFFEV